MATLSLEQQSCHAFRFKDGFQQFRCVYQQVGISFLANFLKGVLSVPPFLQFRLLFFSQLQRFLPRPQQCDPQLLEVDVYLVIHRPTAKFSSLQVECQSRTSRVLMASRWSADNDRFASDEDGCRPCLVVKPSVRSLTLSMENGKSLFHQWWSSMVDAV